LVVKLKYRRALGWCFDGCRKRHTDVECDDASDGTAASDAAGHRAALAVVLMALPGELPSDDDALGGTKNNVLAACEARRHRPGSE
jgi:hypothetical protein